MKTAIRWTILLACLLLIGPAITLPLAGVRDVHGGGAVSLLVGASVTKALFAAALLLIGVLIASAAVGRAMGQGAGMTAGGFLAVWGAFRTGDVEDLVRSAQGSGPFAWLLAEAVFVVVVGVCATLLSARSEKSGGAGLLAHFARPMGKEEPKPALVLATAALAGVAGGVVASLTAFHAGKGQAVFAAFAGAMAAGLVAQFVGTSWKLSPRPVLVVLGVGAAALAGPVLLMALHGGTALRDALAGSLTPLSRVLATDWLVGMLLGVPVGMSWGGAMLEEGPAKTGAPATQR